MSDLQCSMTMEDEVSAEFQCDTNECDTEVRWFVRDTEVHDGGAYKIQQIGYIHRLIIASPALSDTVTVSVVASTGNSKLESRLKMKGKEDSEHGTLYYSITFTYFTIISQYLKTPGPASLRPIFPKLVMFTDIDCFIIPRFFYMTLKSS